MEKVNLIRAAAALIMGTSLVVGIPKVTSEFTGIVFTPDANAHWQVTLMSGAPAAITPIDHYTLVASDITSSSGSNGDLLSLNTNVPITETVEVIIPIPDHQLDGACSTPTYTGNPTVDFACEISFATANGYSYFVGKSVLPIPPPLPECDKKEKDGLKLGSTTVKENNKDKEKCKEKDDSKTKTATSTDRR